MKRPPVQRPGTGKFCNPTQTNELSFGIDDEITLHGLDPVFITNLPDCSFWGYRVHAATSILILSFNDSLFESEAYDGTGHCSMLIALFEAWADPILRKLIYIIYPKVFFNSSFENCSCN